MKMVSRLTVFKLLGFALVLFMACPSAYAGCGTGPVGGDQASIAQTASQAVKNGLVGAAVGFGVAMLVGATTPVMIGAVVTGAAIATVIAVQEVATQQLIDSMDGF